MTIPKYGKLVNARYELVTYLETISKHHITRILIENAIHDIDKATRSDPTIRSCTPESGYVEMKFKEIGGY